MAKPSRRKKTISVDFTGVEAGGGSVAIEDGTYKAEVESIEEKESEEGNPYLKWIWKGLSGDAKGKKIYDNTSLQPQSLWRLKGMLDVLRVDADGATDLDPEEIIGLQAMLEITNEKYKGKDQPRVTGFSMIKGEGEEEEEETEEEEEDAKPVKKKGAAKKAAKPEPEEEEETEEEEEEEEEEEAKPVKKKGAVEASSGKLKQGQKVKFDTEDDDGDAVTVKGVITELGKKTSKVEDKSGEEWSVDNSELTAL